LNRLPLLCLAMVGLMVGLLIPGVSSAQPLQGDVRVHPSQEGAVWVGEKLDLNVELWSNGYSFSGQQFNLPEVVGAYLLQADSSTIKLTEQRNGETWQGLQYSILVYPQRSGSIEIPPFSVEFSAAAGYGSEATPFQFETTPVVIESRLPPGAGSSDLVVTSSEFKMSWNWSRSAEPDEPLELKTGGALTLTVERGADDVPGMVFAPLPDFQIDGLKAYYDNPSVNDRVNRGKLRGSRSDSVTFMCEREGSFEIPPMTFKWWDPDREEMYEEVIPGFSLQVIANPAFQQPEESVGKTSAAGFSVRHILTLLVAVSVLIFAGWKIIPLVKKWFLNRRQQIEAGEPWAFKRAVAACKAGNPSDAYSSINLWLARASKTGNGITLLASSDGLGSPELENEYVGLQSAVVAGGSSKWNGKKLAHQLEQLRSQLTRKASSPGSLPPLNPRA